MNKIPEDLITITEAVERLKVSRNTLYRHIRSGSLNKYKFYGKTYLRESEVAPHIKKGEPLDSTTKKAS